MTSSYLLANDALVSHSFNRDGTEMAISVNSSDVYLLSVPTSSNAKFKILDILKEHTALVTSVDWAPKSNCIVSCSADRNAYVWTKQSDGKWKPSLVVLLIDRAAICVRWSPLENRFAVGSGSKCVAICSFNPEQDWWGSKRIKKQIKSTVTCVDWHPNNVVLACGSTDFRVRVYSAYLKSGDKTSAWGEHSSFGTILFEHYGGEGGWVLSVAFSSDGNKLVWTKQNSLIHIADVSGINGGAGDAQQPAVTSLRTDFLPFISSVWVGTSTFLAAGYDCDPMVFRYTGKNIELVHTLDVGSSSKSDGKMSAMKKFQDIDRMATTDNKGTQLATIHQNCINELRVYKSDQSTARCVSSIGRDGYLVFWELPTLCKQIEKLSIT